jgi:hypothetical protein
VGGASSLGLSMSRAWYIALRGGQKMGVHGGLRIQFEGLSRAEANRAAAELGDRLRDASGDDLNVTIEKEDPDSQDAGSTLVLLFGTSSALAIAQGIAAYLTMCGSRIIIRTKDGTEVIARGEAAKNLDAAAVMRAATSGGRTKAR